MSRRLLLAASLLVALPSGLGCGSKAVDSDTDADPDTDPPIVEEPVGYMGPYFSISSPRRGSIINVGSSEDLPVAVKGVACDPVHELTSIIIDGHEVPPPTDQTCREFNYDRSSRVGLTVIHGTATNTQGQVGSVAQSFLRGPTFFPRSLESDPEARASSGLFVGLGQGVLDDGDRADMDDLVTIINHALNQVDFDALIGPIQFADPDGNGDGEVDRHGYDCVFWTEYNYYTGYRIRKISPFSHDGIRVVRLEFVDGGIEVEVGLTNARVKMDVTGYLDLDCAGETEAGVGGVVRIPGEAILRSRATVAIGEDGGLQVVFGDTTLVANDPVIDLDLGVLDFISSLVEPIVNALAGSLTGMLTEVAADSIEGVLDDVMSSSVSQLTVNESITLPAPLSTTVNIESGFDLADVTAQGMRLGAYTQVSPASAKPEHLDAPYGAISYGGATPKMDLAANPFQIGIKDDLVNQFMWAVWLGGGLDIDDISAFVDPAELQGMDVKVFPILPPVIMSGQGTDEIEVGLGDVRVTVTVPPVDETQEPLVLEVYVSMIVGGQIRTDNTTNRLVAKMDPNPEVFLQVASVSDPSQVDPALISIINDKVGLVLQEMMPGVLENILGSFPLPSINIGDISDLMPDVELQLSAADFKREGNYYVLAGNMDDK